MATWEEEYKKKQEDRQQAIGRMFTEGEIARLAGNEEFWLRSFGPAYVRRKSAAKSEVPVVPLVPLSPPPPPVTPRVVQPSFGLQRFQFKQVTTGNVYTVKATTLEAAVIKLAQVLRRYGTPPDSEVAHLTLENEHILLIS